MDKSRGGCSREWQKETSPGECRRRSPEQFVHAGGPAGIARRAELRETERGVGAGETNQGQRETELT